jgi:hypothetical protein
VGKKELHEFVAAVLLDCAAISKTTFELESPFMFHPKRRDFRLVLALQYAWAVQVRIYGVAAHSSLVAANLFLERC